MAIIFFNAPHISTPLTSVLVYALRQVLANISATLYAVSSFSEAQTMAVGIPAATSSALIYVGVLMIQGLKNVDFSDIDQAVPVSLMLLAMPISGSIGHGIGLGLIGYTGIKVFSGKFKEVSWLTYAITVLFLVKFVLVV